ncbi:MAG: TetR/AcrR family transcriptional regulator [Bacilli bacterium]|nr:TetR/AcrR family transcriptional regulator [Bacilli bacterium]
MKEYNKTALKIIKESLVEFGEKGYINASTNTISKNAGVSKGVVFLHFVSKVNLYYETFIYYLEELVSEIEKLSFKENLTFYEKAFELTYWKMDYFSTRINEMNLLMEALSNPPLEIKEKIYSQTDKLSKMTISWFVGDLDMSEYDPLYTKEEVVKFISYALAGLQQTILKPGVTKEYLMSIRDESLKYIEAVVKGMKK